MDLLRRKGKARKRASPGLSANRSVKKVKLWGRTIGAVFLGKSEETAAFEYDPAFARSGIEIVPLTMPLAHQV